MALTTVTESKPDAPDELTEVAQDPLPRTIEGLLQMDFANNLYATNGQAKALDDIVTYTRNSSATFWNPATAISISSGGTANAK